MAEITRQYLSKKRNDYQAQIQLLTGALAALDEIERELLGDALSMSELQQALGAAEIEEPQPVAA
jgi:hypothetical protein